jgi:hypothetical protein
MSASAPEATAEDSRGSRSSRPGPERPPAPVLALVGATLLAALMLVVSTFLDLYEISTGITTLDTLSGNTQHDVAFILLGLAAIPMALGALRGARPAMAAIAALGVVVLIVTFTVDLPNALDEGLYGVNYENAEASPAAGFYVEGIAGALLLAAGGLLLLLGRPEPDAE